VQLYPQARPGSGQQRHRTAALLYQPEPESLFCGSHAGAERAASIYSLACSCILNGINTFEYLTDILKRFAYISPNASDEVFHEFLPDKCAKNSLLNRIKEKRNLAEG
jgi:hypothetical protein